MQSTEDEDKGGGWNVAKLPEESLEMNRITKEIIGAAIEVHRQLGPGLLESAYEACLLYELRQRGLRVESQKPLPVVYRGMKLDCGYRMDPLRWILRCRR
jgi:hypothetical protein